MAIRGRFRLWRFRRQAKRVKVLAERFDRIMRNMNLTRGQRRQMWREIIKSEDVRREAFESLIGDKP